MRILLVRLRQIGDVVLTTPAVAALRRRYPDARLTYLVEPSAAPVVETNAHLDQVVVAPPSRGASGFLRDLALGLRLRRERFDLAIDFHGGPRASLLTRLSGARERIGYDVIGRGWMYTRRVARPRVLRKRHSVVTQWDLLTPLGIDPPTPSTYPVDMPRDESAAARAAAWLQREGVASDERLAIVHVSASSPFRRWPVPAFVQTVVALASMPRCRVALTAGPSDRGAVDTIIGAARAQLDEPSRARILTCDHFSLAELRALVEQSAVYIGGDSGPLHIAATTAVPIVALFGPTPSERSAPWRNPDLPVALMEVNGLECRPCEQRVCTPGDFRCLTWIQPDEVIAAARRFLDGEAVSRRRLS